ncbi:unknown [Bacteroides sp. CAG:144]|nr:unknown [Bacteroides sp. CAG:144]
MKIILREKGKNPSLFISIISVNEVFLLFQFLYKINSLHL